MIFDWEYFIMLMIWVLGSISFFALLYCIIWAILSAIDWLRKEFIFMILRREKMINIDPKEKALLFVYSDNFLKVYEGYVSTNRRKLYFYKEDVKGRFGKIRQIDDEPGMIKNHALWFRWDATDEQRHELSLQATNAFIEYYTRRHAKAIDEQCDCLKHMKCLEGIYDEISMEGKDE